MTDRIAVVGLWHLGCTIAASWARLGHVVRGIDFNQAVVDGLDVGRAPLYEPGLDQSLAEGRASGRLSFGTDASAVAGSRFVFVAYDTLVCDDDTSDTSPIWDAVEACAPHLNAGTIVIFSAQLPVGTSRALRARLRAISPSLEVVYVPENLRLGEAIRCYLEPGSLVIGADAAEAGDAVEALFAPLSARYVRMSLPSAEMAKHCINTFLATSVTLANQWADVCVATGADFADVTVALRADPRIGERAYITPGVGFSGGTLGRDLRVLSAVSERALAGAAPLFGEVWRYNEDRKGMVARRAAALVDGLRGRRIGLLGMTYKPGTSTLRRSLPLAVAADLLAGGAEVRAHDPRADWGEVSLPSGLVVANTPLEAAQGADLLILLTEWPEYGELDFDRVAALMRRPLLFDTKGFLRSRQAALVVAGLQVTDLMRGPQGAPR